MVQLYNVPIRLAASFSHSVYGHILIFSQRAFTHVYLL